MSNAAIVYQKVKIVGAKNYLLEGVRLSGEFLEAAVVVLHRLQARRRDEHHVGGVLRGAQSLQRLMNEWEWDFLLISWEET